jgi:hypothetical protein
MHVQLHPRTHRDDRHTGDIGLAARLPLPQRQIGHLVPGGREALGEVAVPALGAADGVGEQAVIDQADAHAASASQTSSTLASRGLRYLFARLVFEPPDRP